MATAWEVSLLAFQSKTVAAIFLSLCFKKITVLVIPQAPSSAPHTKKWVHQTRDPQLPSHHLPSQVDLGKVAGERHTQITLEYDTDVNSPAIPVKPGMKAVLLENLPGAQLVPQRPTPESEDTAGPAGTLSGVTGFPQASTHVCLCSGLASHGHSSK